MKVIRVFFGVSWLAIMAVSWQGIYAGLQASPNFGASVLMLLTFIGIGVLLIVGIPVKKKPTSTRITRKMDNTIEYEGWRGKYPKHVWDEVNRIINDFSWLEDEEYMGEIEIELEGGSIVNVNRYYYNEEDFNERGFIHGQMQEK